MIAPIEKDSITPEEVNRIIVCFDCAPLRWTRFSKGFQCGACRQRLRREAYRDKWDFWEWRQIQLRRLEHKQKGFTS